MRKNHVLLAIAPCLVASLALVRVAAAQSGGTSTGSMSDSPYKNGPPPITGGYTDTTQGGTKTSGDMPVMPPRSKDDASAAKGAEQPPQGGAGSAGSTSQGAKAPGGS
jgi:hypothetical protein